MTNDDLLKIIEGESNDKKKKKKKKMGKQKNPQIDSEEKIVLECESNLETEKEDFEVEIFKSKIKLSSVESNKISKIKPKFSFDWIMNLRV